MNERIRELALQTDIECEHLGQSDIGEDWLAKFAELIVQECVKVLITGEGNDNTADAIWDLESLGVDMNQILNNIFGFEE